MSSDDQRSSRFPWTELIRIRGTKVSSKPEVKQSPGRPPMQFQFKKLTTTVTSGDKQALITWQERLRPLLQRKPSLGETAGILARICEERIQLLDIDLESLDLEEFVSLMVGEEA